MFLETLILKISTKITRDINQEENQPIIDYGLKIIIGSLMKIILLVVLSYIFGILLEISIIVPVACIFRLISGGAHCTSYERCLITSIVIFLSLGYLSQQLNYILLLKTAKIIFVVTSILLYLIIIKWAPGKHEERTYTKQKILISKALLIIYITVLLLVSYNLYEVNYIISILLGLVLQSFTFTPLGYKFFAKIDNLLIKTI